MKSFFSWAWLLVLSALCVLNSCSNPAQNFTNAALSAVLQKEDSLAQMTRNLTREATTTATFHARMAVESTAISLTATLADKADTLVENSADRIDASIERFYSSADRTVNNARRELTHPANLRFLAQARDTMLGKPTQRQIQALVRVAFQEFRRQQDSTLLSLEHRSDTWESRVKSIATPILSVVGALVLLAVAILLIIRALKRAQQRYHEYRQHRTET
jgi:hypothetical protein